MKKILLCGLSLSVSPFSAVAQELLLDKATLNKLNKIELKKNDSLSLKTNKNIKDIPVSVFSLDKSVYELQGLKNLQELTGSVSSLQPSGNDYGVGDKIEIRGLSVAHTSNSLSNNVITDVDGFSPVRSLTNADSVQVIKGANSSLYGIGSVGGMLNITTKTPLNSKYNSVKLTLGSFNTYGVLADYTQKNTNNISSRFVANIYNSRGWRKVQDQKIEFFPSIAVNKGSSQLVLMGEVSNHKNHFDSIGHPLRFYQNKVKSLPLPDFGKIGNGHSYNTVSAYGENGSTFLNSDHKKAVEDTITKNTGFRVFDIGDSALTGGILRPAKTKNMGASFKHSNEINGWNVTQYGQVKKTKQNYVRLAGAYNYLNYEGSYKLNNQDEKEKKEFNVNPRSPLVKDDQIYPYALRRAEYRRRYFKENSIDYSIDLNKEFNVNGKKHDVLFVAGYKNQSLDVKQASVYDSDNINNNTSPAPYILDMRKPILPSKNFEEYTVFKKDEYLQKNTTYFAGVNDVVELSDDLIVRGGFSWVKYLQKRHNYRCNVKNTGYVSNCPITTLNDKAYNINFGATYKVDPKLNIFFGYAAGSTPHEVTGTDADKANVMLGAQNIELGTKYTLPNDGLLTFTLFNTAKTNQAFSYNTGKKDSNDEIIYKTLYSASEFTHGYEVDLAYKPSENSFVSIAYANTNSRKNQRIGSKINSFEKMGIAKHTFNLFGSYTLPGKINPLRKQGQLTVFGNVKYVSKRKLPMSPWVNKVLDTQMVYLEPYAVVNVGARLDMLNKWSAVFRLNNLQNKRYYERRLYAGGLPGASRNFILTLEKKF